MDLHLPPDISTIEGGLTVIRNLRQVSKAMRIIAISAHQGAGADRRSRAAGAVILLNKPVQRTILLDLLQNTNGEVS